MKFILLTNPGLENSIVQELLDSGLRPEMIVTESPFYYKSNNIFKYLIKKILRRSSYLRNKNYITQKFQPYFLAKKHRVPIFFSKDVNTKKFENKVKEMKIDYIFTFGFRLLKENVINAPTKGCINFHPAYLPSNRGATPSKWVILNSQNQTGITFHYISKGIDTGSIIEQYRIPLTGLETAKILNEYLFNLGAFLFTRLIFKIEYNIRMNLTRNEVKLGSYEPPFKKKNSIITKYHTFKEISGIINASRDGLNNAVYWCLDKEYEILNYFVIRQDHSNKNDYPFLDTNKNIVYRTIDNRIVILITKKIKTINLNK